MSPKKRPRQLIIDTSIMGAAGSQPSRHPTSSHCRVYLTRILELGHEVVTTPAINQEFRRHRTRFATTWLTAMYGRKKIVPLPPETLEDISSQVKRLKDPNVRDILLKDCLLIEAALATDQNVSSLDDKARFQFANFACLARPVGEIVWVNPSKANDEEPLAWLERGAPAEAARKLKNYRKDEQATPPLKR